MIHRAVIWVYAEVHELNKNNECSGNPVHRVERFPLYLDGNNKYEAIQKLNEVISGVKVNVSKIGS